MPDVNDFFRPENSLVLLLNTYIDDSWGNLIGNIKQRPGYTILGAQIRNKPILGMGTLRNASASINEVFVTIDDATSTNANIYRFNGTAWVDAGATNKTASTKMRFTQFVNYVFAMNGVDAIQTSTNGTVWGTTNAVSMPTVAFGTPFLGRLLTSGNPAAPSRLYLSSVATYPTLSISWTVGNDTVDINPDDSAGGITALEQVGGKMLIFKERAIYIWDGNENTQQDLVIDIGTFSQECVTSCKGYTFFLGQKADGVGIFMTKATYPVEISRAVRSFLDAIPSSYYDNFTAWSDDNNAYFGIGDVTVNGRDFTNTVLRFNIPISSWSVFSYADEFTKVIRYINANGDLDIIGGTTTGKVHTLHEGTSDNSVAINWEFQTKAYEFGNRSANKTVKALGIFCINGAGGTLYVKPERDKPAFTHTMTSGFSTVVKNANITGRDMTLIGSGSNLKDPFEFEGVEFINVSYDALNRYP